MTSNLFGLNLFSFKGIANQDSIYIYIDIESLLLAPIASSIYILYVFSTRPDVKAGNVFLVKSKSVFFAKSFYDRNFAKLTDLFFP